MYGFADCEFTDFLDCELISIALAAISEFSTYQGDGERLREPQTPDLSGASTAQTGKNPAPNVPNSENEKGNL